MYKKTKVQNSKRSPSITDELALMQGIEMNSHLLRISEVWLPKSKNSWGKLYCERGTGRPRHQLKEIVTKIISKKGQSKSQLRRIVLNREEYRKETAEYPNNFSHENRDRREERVFNVGTS